MLELNTFFMLENAVLYNNGFKKWQSPIQSIFENNFLILGLKWSIFEPI